MPFLLINNASVRVSDYAPVPVKAEDSARAVDNSLRWVVAGLTKWELTLTAGPMDKADADALIGVLLTNGTVTVAGDELGATLTCRPEVTGISVIRNKLAWAKSVQFTLREI